MYLVIPVLFATRTEPKLRGFVDGTLLFGTPIVAFGLQSRLVAHMEYGLAVSAVVLALLYIGMATFLYRSRRESLRVLVEAQLALSVAFVTVAVPLALDARWTSAAWALQGAALVWLAFRQQRKLALVAGVALQALSGVAYIEQAPVAAGWPILNGYCLGALMLALAGFFSARLFDPARDGRAEHPSLPDWLAKLLSIALLVWALAAGGRPHRDSRAVGRGVHDASDAADAGSEDGGAQRGRAVVRALLSGVFATSGRAQPQSHEDVAPGRGLEEAAVGLVDDHAAGVAPVGQVVQPRQQLEPQPVAQRPGALPAQATPRSRARSRCCGRSPPCARRRASSSAHVPAAPPCQASSA